MFSLVLSMVLDLFDQFSHDSLGTENFFATEKSTDSFSQSTKKTVVSKECILSLYGVKFAN